MTGRFTLAPDGEVVGFSVWPEADGYVPVAGLFVDGRLQTTAVCDQPRPAYMPVVSRRLPARAWRRLRGVRIRPVPIALGGAPDACVWFRMTPEPAVLERLAARDPAVRLQRLEDGEPLLDPTTPPAQPRAPGAFTVEQLLEMAAATADADASRLDGYAAVAALPARHRLDLLFLSVLERAPDPMARSAYLGQLESGEISLFDLRRMVLESDEFRRRRIAPHDRVGQLLCAQVWREVALHPAVGFAAARDLASIGTAG